MHAKKDDQLVELVDESELASVQGGLSFTFWTYLFNALSGPREHGNEGSPGDGTVPGDGIAGP